VLEKPPSCKGCPLDNLGKGFMIPDGTGENGVVLLAEALGEAEVRRGLPLVGPSGFLLGRALQRVGLKREDFLLLNTIFCQPPFNKFQGMPYKYGAWEHCDSNMDSAIRKLKEQRGDKPIVIVTLGDIPLEKILGVKGVMECRGYVFWSLRYSCWVVPTLHPAYILRGNFNLQPVLSWDIARAVRIAEQGYQHEDIRILEDPSVTEWEDWVNNYDPSQPLAFDIETPHKEGKDEDDLDEDDPSTIILRVSFANSPTRGVSVPWAPAYMPRIRTLLGSFGEKVVWNAPYDVPRIQYNGVDIRGLIRDSMISWHVLNSDLPKKLGFVAPFAWDGLPMWKHLSHERPAFYNGIDAIALWRTDQWVLESLHKQKIWDVYERQVQLVDPILAKMCTKGMLVDQAAKEQLSQTTGDELVRIVEEMQQVVPDSVKPKQIYTKPREGTIPVGGWKKVKICTLCGKRNVNKKHPCFKNPEILPVEEVVPVEKWQLTLPFTPSPKQLVEYAQSKHHYVYKHYKTGNPTMNEEAITKMMKKYSSDPLYQLVLDHRGVQKIKGTYVDGLHLGADGRVHGFFSHSPSTLRLSMRSPNLQNQPRGGDDVDPIWKQIRNMFIAAPGSLLGARDYSGIEAVIVGWFAQDPSYIRLAKLGIHAWLCSHLVGHPADLSWSDADLRGYFKQLKKEHDQVYNVAKRVVHLSNYLGTPSKMHEVYPETFSSTKEAEKYQGLYFELAPSIPRWHKSACDQVNKLGYLRCPDGFPHRYWNIYKWERTSAGWTNRRRDGSMNWGEDAKRMIACGPQHMAAVYVKESLIALGDDPIVYDYLILTVHDEIMWEAPEKETPVVDERVRTIMERPMVHLPLDPSWNLGPYLSIGTEGKYGRRWGEMK
jgi:uracil-DNA glycosylase family 4